MKITIRLFALDGMGMPFPTRNEQTTYLHIVRLGPAPAGADAEGSTTTGANNEKEPATEAEDARPWVVKVVKREASIGLTLSIYTKSTASPPTPLSLRTRLHLSKRRPHQITLTHPRRPTERLHRLSSIPPRTISAAAMTPRRSACCVCRVRARSSSFHVAIWLRAASAR